MLLGVVGREGIFGNFEDLAFDDAADLVEVGAALAFDFGSVDGLAPQPEDDSRWRP